MPSKDRVFVNNSCYFYDSSLNIEFFLPHRTLCIYLLFSLLFTIICRDFLSQFKICVKSTHQLIIIPNLAGGTHFTAFVPNWFFSLMFFTLCKLCAEIVVEAGAIARARCITCKLFNPG